MERILTSSNYDRFELLSFNRDVYKTDKLEASMKQHGFISAYPLHVVKNGNGKFKIKDGHNRFYVARKLGIPVKYVECNDTASVYELQNTTKKWSVTDYLTSFVRMGRESYIQLKEFVNLTGIPIVASAALLIGQSGMSGNVTYQLKSGEFEIKDTNNAGIVADIVLHCRAKGLLWATTVTFVGALSRLCFLPEFDPSVFKHRIDLNTGAMVKKATMDQYTELFDYIYNKAAKVKIPLKFLADEAARQRALANL